MMTADRDRWARVKDIFDSARTLAPDARAPFLHDACKGDTALQREVESLLAAHAEAGDFAERPAIDVLARTASQGADFAAPALPSGFEIGTYRIVEALDAGAMGEVYRAVDTRLGRDVAIKVLPAARARDADRIARLEGEARLLASLNHPHIATIHGLEVVPAGGAGQADLKAIVMELVEGPTLADRLSDGPLPLDAALELARQIAEALEAAHARGIIHSDLKPANIKFTPAGAAKVLDFGLARTMAANLGDARMASGVSGRQEIEGVIAGTPGYMSPEQARGERIDARTDVWAFGCVVYEMLTGRPAFGRETLADTLEATVEGDPDWNGLPSNVPPGIRRMLRRCLERDSRRRLHHIADARIEIEEAVSASDPESSIAPSSRRERVLGVSIGVLCLAFLAVLGAWLLHTPADVAELRVVEITTPPTSDPSSFALSPDGRRIAFVADHEGQPRLWVRSLDAAGAQVLPGTTGARRPFWSPDSRSIGFFAGSDLKRIEARGGPPLTIASVAGGTTGAWASDGTILFSSTTSPSLRRVNAAGGAVGLVTRPAAHSGGHGHPQFLPGDREFLLYVGGSDDVRGVYVGSLDSSEVMRLLAADTQASYVPPGWLLFARQGTLLAQRFDVARRTLSGAPITVADSVSFDSIIGVGAFSVSGTGLVAYRPGVPSVKRLSWFDRTGATLGSPGSPEHSGFSNLRLSPDGRRVAAERTVGNETDLWLLDATHQSRFTRASGGVITRLPIWSSDGRRIAFESVAPGSVRLSAKSSTAGGDEEVLFESPETKIPCDWSPDGRFLMYYAPDPTTGTDLWVLRQGTRTPAVFLRTEANELWGQFSPDGNWVAYQSNETGRFEIYVRPFPGPGEQFPISTAGGVYPRWSRDGKELYYIGPDGKMMAVSIRSTAPTFEAGVPMMLFQTRRVGGGSNVIGNGHQYDVARDGRFLINVEGDSGVSSITLLMNWR